MSTRDRPRSAARWSSSHVQLARLVESPTIENVHSRAACAASARPRAPGSRSVRYWPGGHAVRAPPVVPALPRKPRETCIAGRQSCGGLGQALERADRIELSARRPHASRTPAGVRVKCVEETAVRGERLVTHALRAEVRRRGHRLLELERRRRRRVARDRAVAEVRHPDEAAVLGRDRPADLAARVRDRAGDRRSEPPPRLYDEAAALPTAPPKASVTTSVGLRSRSRTASRRPRGRNRIAQQPVVADRERRDPSVPRSVTTSVRRPG
jgi:hypothetical protein